MPNLQVHAENLGPIPVADFTLPGYGVTIVSAPNGYGKSVLCDALKAAQAGTGRVPLRDGERRGSLSAFGATIQIGDRTRHGGALEVLSLTGKFDLAALVDPKLKDPAAADRARIKQLILLANPQVSLEPFRNSPLLSDFESVVDASAADTKDMVETAVQVKRCYEAASRKAEQDAMKVSLEMQNCQAVVDETDMEAEHNEAFLLERYNVARDNLVRLNQRATDYQNAVKSRQTAQEQLQRLQAEYSGPTEAEAAAALSVASVARQEAVSRVAALQAELMAAVAIEKAAVADERLAEQKHKAAKQHESSVKACQSILTAVTNQSVPQDALTDAAVAKKDAEDAMSLGATVRIAMVKQAEKLALGKEWATLDRRAASMRTAALSVEDILSDLLDCPALSVKHGRLVVTGHTRGDNTLFHELSQGEAYRIAIDIAAEKVGTDGVLVVEQEGWESLDTFVRGEVHQHAADRKVHILAFEATRDPTDGHNMVVRHYAGA